MIKGKIHIEIDGEFANKDILRMAKKQLEYTIPSKLEGQLDELYSQSGQLIYITKIKCTTTPIASIGDTEPTEKKKQANSA